MSYNINARGQTGLKPKISPDYGCPRDRGIFYRMVIMTKEIKLTKGKFVIVDDDLYEYLNQWKWHYLSSGYAARRDKKGKTILMHRLILQTPEGLLSDHKDNNRLNNQRSNLRICNDQQNSANSSKQFNKSSIYKGVCWVTEKKTWRAAIKINQKYKFLAYCKTPEEAALIYDEAARKYFGEFARTNF